MSAASSPEAPKVQEGPNRRSFLARGAAVAAVPAVAALAGGAFAERASAATLPEYAPVPPSSLGPAVNAQGYYVGRVEKNLYWVTDAATAMAYPWKHFIGGHMGRLGTRDDMVVYQQYVDDLIVSVKQALTAIDPTPFFVK